MRAGVPYKIVGGTRFFERAEIRDVLAYLRTVVNPADEVSLRRIVNTPRRGIGDATVDKIAALASQRGTTLLAAFEARRRRGTAGQRPGRQGRGLPGAAEQDARGVRLCAAGHRAGHRGASPAS